MGYIPCGQLTFNCGRQPKVELSLSKLISDITLTIRIEKVHLLIRESVDSLCRDGADMPGPP